MKKPVISDSAMFDLPPPLGSVGKPDVVDVERNKSVFGQ